MGNRGQLFLTVFLLLILTFSFTGLASPGSGKGPNKDSDGSSGAGPNKSILSQDDTLSLDANSLFGKINILSNDKPIRKNDQLLVKSINNQLPEQWHTLSSGAKVFVDQTGGFTYQPNGAFDSLLSGESASENIIYTVADNKGNTASATIIVSVNGVKVPVEPEDPVDPVTSPDVDPPPYYVSGLIFGEEYRVNLPNSLGSPTVVTYAFLTEVPTYYGSDHDYHNSFVAFSEQQQQASRDILASVERFTGLTFIEVPEEEAGLTFGLAYLGGFDGVAYRPMGHGVGTAASDIWINSDFGSVFIEGTHSYAILLHELGHALGLSHPDLPVAEENNQYTVMDSLGHPTMAGSVTGFQIYDIAALQYLYGMSQLTALDNVYSFRSLDGIIRTISDNGGHDIIDLSEGTHSVSVNLTEGKFSTISESGANNIAIALGTVIEDVAGSPYPDRLAGNSASNRLTGGDGADIFYFDQEWGKDIITDFVNGEDLISLERAGLNYFELSITTTPGGILIEHSQGTILLHGVTSVTEADFL